MSRRTIGPEWTKEDTRDLRVYQKGGRTPEALAANAKIRRIKAQRTVTCFKCGATAQVTKATLSAGWWVQPNSPKQARGICPVCLPTLLASATTIPSGPPLTHPTCPA